MPVPVADLSKKRKTEKSLQNDGKCNGIDKTADIDASYRGNAVNLLTAFESRVHFEFTLSNQRRDSVPFNVTIYTPDTLG